MKTGRSSDSHASISRCRHIHNNLTHSSQNTSGTIGEIVTCMKFLGAGAIIAQGGRVQGITSATTLLVVAGIGLVVGTRKYILGGINTALIFGTLEIDQIKRFSEGGTYHESDKD